MVSCVEEQHVEGEGHVEGQWPLPESIREG